jgi:hypothetical protein
MNQLDILEAVLGGWGAALSTILAIDQLRQRRRGRVNLAAEWYPPKDELQVEIVNIGTSPITVRSVDLVYGESNSEAPPFLQIASEPFKLEGGQLKDWVLPRDRVVEARAKSDLKIGQSNLVWVRAQLFGVGQKLAPVSIDAGAIQATGLYTPAEQSIAADLFVGFPVEQVKKQPRKLVGSRFE